MAEGNGNVTVNLNKGDKIELRFRTYKIKNMIDDHSNLGISLSTGFLYIREIL